MITRAVCPIMVGREEELSRIEDALLAACRGVLGETTNFAARLQAQALAGEILVSEEAFRRLRDLDGSREQLELKGFSEPVTAFRLPT